MNLNQKNPSALKIKEIFDKREKLTRKRNLIMGELQTLLDKTSEDIKIKFDKIYGD